MPTESAPDRLARTALRVRDRFLASDPGLGRLRAATSAALCVGTALPVQLAVAALLGYQSRVGLAATLFGAVVATLASSALVASPGQGRVRAAAWFPLAVALGVLPAALLEGQRLAQVAGFTVALFAAVWVRRFGPAFFFYGFMAWMGFFFATFLQATWSLVPELLLASVVSTVWVLALSTTVLATDPARVLRSAWGAFFSHGRSVAQESADVLAVPVGAVGRRRRAEQVLADRRAALSEIALVVDSWSARPGALPEGWSAGAVRRRAIEAQQATERFARSVGPLAEPGVDLELREGAWRTLEHLARRRDHSAVASSHHLDRCAERVQREGGSGWWQARHVAYGVREFLRLDAAADEPPVLDPGEEDFEATTGLVFGRLPGAPAVAREVAARGGSWNPMSRLSLTSRQAVQVALAGLLAIGLGSLLSPTRYYWAVIAAFVTFTGTGTRSETLLKGTSRIGGTLLGIGAAIALAHVTVGSEVAIFTVIVVAIFFAYYLASVSYTAMTFFITVLLGQLYVVLGTFSDGLLALRLGETAVGAAAGVVVALVFAPLSTRDTVRAAQVELFTAMRALLEAVAAHVEGERVELDSLTRALDDRARRMALVARPLTRSVVGGTSSRRTRRRVGRAVAAVSMCRALALAVQVRHAAGPIAVATACRALAEATDALAAVPPGQPAPAALEPLVRSDRALFDDPASTGDSDLVVRHLHHLAATLTELSELSETHPTQVAPT